jgi:hypothetical protein
MEALRRVIGDFRHLREHLADGVAHALDRAAFAAGHAAHVIQGQALGAAGESARQFKDFPGFVIAHEGYVRF